MFCSQHYPVDLAFCAYDAGVDEGVGVVVDFLTRFCAVGGGSGGRGVRGSCVVGVGVGVGVGVCHGDCFILPIGSSEGWDSSQ